MAAVLVCFDQSRLQPWFYQYAIMLVALGLCARRPDETSHETCLNGVRLILVNGDFTSGAACRKRILDSWRTSLPLVDEAGAAVFALRGTSGLTTYLRSGGALAWRQASVSDLVFRKTRSAAFVVLAAVAMHGLILVALGPAGHNRNSVVWSWNLAMICFLVLLYWRQRACSPGEILWSSGAAYPKAILLLVTLAPALSFFGLWDNYLSWALYAGNKTDASLYIASTVKNRLPASIQRYTEEDEDGRYELSVYDWSFGEMNVPPYPEARIYRNLARSLCTYAEDASDVELVVESKTLWLHSGGDVKYNCGSLLPTSSYSPETLAHFGLQGGTLHAEFRCRALIAADLAAGIAEGADDGVAFRRFERQCHIFAACRDRASTRARALAACCRN